MCPGERHTGSAVTRRGRRIPSTARRARGARLLWTIVFAVAVTVVLIVAFGAFGSSGGPTGKASLTGVTTSGTARSTTAGQGSPSPSPSAKPVVTVVAGGDVMADWAVDQTIRVSGADSVLAGIAPLTRTADVAMVNLESTLSTAGSAQTWKDVVMEGNPALAPALKRAGIDVVTMANNHALDYGSSALLDTISRLRRLGIAVVGAGANSAGAHKPAILERDGVRIAFLGYSDILPQGYVAGSGPGIAAARTDLAALRRDIRAAGRRADYVAVAFHWGVEVTTSPVGDQVSEAHAAIDAGADLVLGSHPHVLQGLEVYRHRLIMYSFGNLVFPHSSSATGETLLLKARVSRRGIAATLYPVYLSPSGIPAVVHGAQARSILTRVQQLSTALGADLRLRGDVAVLTTASGR